MNIYGPSAATGLGAGSAATAFATGHPTVFVFLAAFTLISAATAAIRTLPKLRRRTQQR